MRSLIAFPLLATDWRLKKHIEGGVHAIRITWGTDWACMGKCSCDERLVRQLHPSVKVKRGSEAGDCGSRGKGMAQGRLNSRWRR